MKKKKKIKETIKEEIEGELNGSIDSVIAYLKTERDELIRIGYDKIVIEHVSYGYNGEFYINLVGERLETDKEYNRRILAEEKEKAKKQASKLKYKEKIEREAKKLGLIK